MEPATLPRIVHGRLLLPPAAVPGGLWLQKLVLTRPAWRPAYRSCGFEETGPDRGVSL